MTREEAALASLVYHGLLAAGISFQFDIQETGSYSIFYPSAASPDLDDAFVE